MSRETTINASARMVHIEIEGDDAFVAGAVSGIISRLMNREPEPAPGKSAPGPRKTTKKRATKKAAAGAAAACAPRSVRVTKGSR